MGFKWEPLALMLLVIGLGLWLVWGPTNPRPRPGSDAAELRVGNTRGVVEITRSAPTSTTSTATTEPRFRVMLRDGYVSHEMGEAEFRLLVARVDIERVFETLFGVREFALAQMHEALADQRGGVLAVLVQGAAEHIFGFIGTANRQKEIRARDGDVLIFRRQFISLFEVFVGKLDLLQCHVGLAAQHVRAAAGSRGNERIGVLESGVGLADLQIKFRQQGEDVGRSAAGFFFEDGDEFRR